MADRPRPDAADTHRERPEDALEAGPAGGMRAAWYLGPLLVVLGLAAFLFPVFGEATFLVGIVLLALSPGVLAVGWPPGAPAGRGRTVAAIAGAVLTLAVAGAGLLANPCASNPLTVALTGGAMALGTFAVALAFGRAFAGQGRVVVPVLAAGVLAFFGFLATAFEVLSKVFLLC